MKPAHAFIEPHSLFVRTNHCKVCKRARNCAKCSEMDPVGAAAVLLQLLFARLRRKRIVLQFYGRLFSSPAQMNSTLNNIQRFYTSLYLLKL